MADSAEPSSDLMTIAQAAQYLRIPRSTAYYLVKTGQLPSVLIGGRNRIKRSLLDQDVSKFTLPDSMAQPAEPSSELMTVKEAAFYLRIPMPTVYYLVQRGQLPAVRIGGRWRIKRSLLDRDVLRKDDESSQTTVLVVDDDPAIQALFKQLLKKASLARVVVGSGAAALAKAKGQRFDLAFLDLQLPDIPGDEVYVQLKELQPDLPIVIVTGYPDSKLLSKIFSSGPVTVIQKPLDYERLNQTVKQLGHKGARGDAQVVRVRSDPDAP